MNTIIIAEIGENHYGRWDLCRGMVEEAAANGASYAKFQTYTAAQFGADHVLPKPFTPKQVLDTLEEVLAERG